MTDTAVPSTPETRTRIPVLPLRDVVVYPQMVIPLFVGREKSILALDEAMARDKQILLVAQRQADVDDPRPKDLYQVGTVATILQLLKLPDGTVKVLVEGVSRAIVEDMSAGEFYAGWTRSYNHQIEQSRQLLFRGCKNMFKDCDDLIANGNGIKSSFQGKCMLLDGGLIEKISLAAHGQH